jgi:hypothetical protein
LVFDGLHGRVRNRPGHRVNFAGVKAAKPGQHGVTVLGHAGEVEALRLAGAEGLAFHGLVGDLPATGENGGSEVAEDFRDLGMEQFTLFLGQGDTGCADALELSGGKDLHLETRPLEGFACIEEWNDDPDGADPCRRRGVDGIALRSDPIGRAAHESAGEGVDELFLGGIGDGFGQFGGAHRGAAGRIDVEENRVHLFVGGRLADGSDGVLGADRVEEPALNQAGATDQWTVETDDADPVIDVEERMGGRIVAQELADAKGCRAGGEVVESLRRDEPGLAAAKNVEGFHAPEGLSTAETGATL